MKIVLEYVVMIKGIPKAKSTTWVTQFLYSEWGHKNLLLGLTRNVLTKEHAIHTKGPFYEHGLTLMPA